MTKLTNRVNSTYHPLIRHLRWAIIFSLTLTHLFAARPPKELTRVIDHFMNLDSVSIAISQVIDWKFSKKSDTVRIQMDIKAGQNFHVLLPDFGMEIFVTEKEMITLNHARQQVLYENATPDALLKQLFVGGDLNDARFKGTKNLNGALRRLDFQFSGDFSDWESLSVYVNDGDDLQKLILVDYDGNEYIISLNFLPTYEDFKIPDVATDFLHYQVADLRGK